MITLYRPGTSIVHRLPAGPKLLGLMLLAIAITVFANNAWSIAGASALVVVGYFAAGFGPLEIARQLWKLRWIVAITLITQVIFLPLPVAATNTGRVVTVVMLATLLTLTTRTSALLDAVERGLAPLRRIGVDPARVGLLMAMTITVVPVIAGYASSIRDAQRARGAKPRLRILVMPLLVMSLKHADDLGDALIARGAE
ncbi:energy-coupling factor transporter transmembrane protein EcfT [Herbiconiux sp. CPCC 205763]|uniref:Energy-coupling factor transporter transmembrane protein EcfT n=1 Tax=Herbiconiux aconitum TaxID=2970913 RepID=A0ABT2GLT8_9MICO|nr:energy-coupling factor transporter transmembrane protein EcfT [Herbiconiux aconitum]MCS5717179.1 energy-coupling factor transporter transmembrane protein EcfT [Herbiconiux aconitum]